MNLQFFDRQDLKNPLNGKAIRGAGEVASILNSLKGRPPFFCELVAENEQRLLIGVGAIACVEHAGRDGSPPYLMAVMEGEQANPQTPEYIEFLIGNTATPVSSRYSVPLAVAAEIGEYFQKTGERTPAVRWEEV
jgi:hypothetical protein